jgi:hypothetical protein
MVLQHQRDVDAAGRGDYRHLAIGTRPARSRSATAETTEPNGDRDRDRQDLGLRYYVLPDDPLAALNILREAAGLEPWPAEGGEPK